MDADTLDPNLLAQWSGGSWRNGVPATVAGFTNDTRTLVENEIFSAFTTSSRDGHDYLETAKTQGASGALVSRFQENVDLPQLIVADVGVALQSMATAYRETWSVPVVGITGSCGKTTCKDLLTAMLGGSRVLSTSGNLNNQIGVPLSILRPRATAARFVVLEAGISEKGEMALLAAMIDPDYVVVTAIGPSHLEDLGSEQTVAEEKGILGRGDRVKVVFAGETCERYAGYLGGVKVRVLKTSSSSHCGELCEKYNEFGDGFASNLVLATAVAEALGVSPKEIAEGLKSWRPSPMRGEWKDFDGIKVFLDCYNANPLSMNDSLNTFVTQSSESEPRLFIVGCMEELGSSSAAYHEQLGIDFPIREQDTLLVIGDEAESVLRGLANMERNLEHCRMIDEVDQAREYVDVFEGNVFLKGSRRYRLEDALAGKRFRQDTTGDASQC